jgi:alkylation response protein AidB-like acyl-CoA dehydrogenase
MTSDTNTTGTDPGSEEHKQRWLPGMAAGDLIGCFGLTEPAAGSDPASMLTTAMRDGDEWVIDGAKRWIGLASIADVAVIWAKTRAAQGRRHAAPRADLLRQAQQRPRSHRHLPRGPHHPGRQRHHAGPLAGAARQQPRKRADLRGH